MRILLLLFCFMCYSCFGADNLALALRFYKGNPYLNNPEKSLFRQIDIAEQKYANDKIKLSLIYYLKGRQDDKERHKQRLGRQGGSQGWRNGMGSQVRAK